VKRLAFAVFLVGGLMCAGSARADCSASAYENLVSSVSTAVRVTTTVPVSFKPDGVRARFTVDTGLVRWRMDGSSPTATSGHLIPSTATFHEVFVNGRNDVMNLRFIGMDPTTATVRITYEKCK
jgi:hypothetical protein